MGADNFETLEDLKENKALQRPDYGVGQNCIVKMQFSIKMSV